MKIEKSGVVFICLLLVGAGVGALVGDVKIGSAVGLGMGIVVIALFRQ